MEIKARQKPNGMYVLSRDDLEEISNSILKEFAPQNLEIPIALDSTRFLTEYLKLAVKEEYIGTLEQGYLGLTVMGDYVEIPSLDRMYRPVILEETYGNVLISRHLLGRENIGRKRYTEVHEGCHWTLHRPYYEKLDNDGHNHYVACRSVERYAVTKMTERDWLEWQADSLAASLLMPEAVFYDYVRIAIRQAGVLRGYLIEGNQHDKRIFYEIVREIAAKFKVSFRAVQIRMVHLNLIRKQAA